jgi:ubiquinone/menaquinone biosynthesis C-methylase UbiE
VTAPVRHPIFARVLERTSERMEPELAPLRRELVAGLGGRVVEVGAGNGISFGYYPESVDMVIAVEPEPYLREKAAEKAAAAPVAIEVRDGVADALPLEDASVDAAVVSQVLCTVPDVGAALAELRRVLKPGGEVRFLEHVRSDRPGKARLQRWIDGARIQPTFAGGCHCGRDIVGALEADGLRIEQMRTVSVGPAWLHTNPHVLGRAAYPRG